MRIFASSVILTRYAGESPANAGPHTREMLRQAHPDIAQDDIVYCCIYHHFEYVLRYSTNCGTYPHPLIIYPSLIA